MSMRPTTFGESRNRAYALLGGAADEIRAGDWESSLTRPQREAVRQALAAIGAAKDALNVAADTGTADGTSTSQRPRSARRTSRWPAA